jgi:hypothetical protein
MSVVEKSLQAKQTVEPLQAKNAVPPAGLDAPQHVFDGVQPQAVVLQRTMGAGLEGNDLDEAALCRYNELHVVTGNSFINQWRPQYLSETFCFDFPRGTGGPEFDVNARLRVQEAPFVSLSDYTQGLPRRVERQLRASWIVVPAVRNLYFRRSLLEAASISYRTDEKALADPDAHGKELCAAAVELYEHLQSGSYKTHDGKMRPISGDLTKLSYVPTLSAKARQLLASMRCVSSQQGGVQEVRTKIGNALFGARVSYGEPVFVTISPSSRHSGLVMRLSRVRANDPLLQHEEMLLGEAQKLGSGFCTLHVHSNHKPRQHHRSSATQCGPLRCLRACTAWHLISPVRLS